MFFYKLKKLKKTKCRNHYKVPSTTANTGMNVDLMNVDGHLNVHLCLPPQERETH